MSRYDEDRFFSGTHHEVGTDELHRMWMQEMLTRAVMVKANAEPFRTSCVRDYSELNLTTDQLIEEARACREAAAYFAERDASGCAQRATLRAEAAEELLMMVNHD